MLKEFSILVEKDEAEELSDFLMDEGVYSVSIEDADADSEDEAPLYGEPGLEPERLAWNRSRLKILVLADFPIAKVLNKCCDELHFKVPEIEAETVVPDNDWVRITQAQFSPTQISEKLWIVPSWHEPPNPSAINIRLDPGVAFGTGTHPTTHLCLEWLSSHALCGRSVLDYGCGSGILAVAAKKLGADIVMGTDIDPQSIEAAKYNAEQNGVEAGFYLPSKLPDEKFNVVVANILSNPLRILAPALISRVKEGGSLVLSGILERQAEELIELYNGLCATLDLKIWETSEGWVCLAGQKK